jgi:hypothetical protein
LGSQPRDPAHAVQVLSRRRTPTNTTGFCKGCTDPVQPTSTTTVATPMGPCVGS